MALVLSAGLAWTAPDPGTTRTPGGDEILFSPTLPSAAPEGPDAREAGPPARGTLQVDGADPFCAPGAGQPDPYAVVYCRIQDAVADAASGDVVMVAAGTYHESVLVPKGLALTGAGAATTVIDGTGLPGASLPLFAGTLRALVVFAPPDASGAPYEFVLEGFTIAGSERMGLGANGNGLGQVGVRVLDCAFEGNAQDHLFLNDVDASAGAPSIVQGSVFTGPSGSYLDGADHVRILDNVFSDPLTGSDQGLGIQQGTDLLIDGNLFDGWDNAGLIVNATTSQPLDAITVSNNDFLNAGEGYGYGIVLAQIAHSAGYGSLVVTGNLFADNSQGGIILSPLLYSPGSVAGVVVAGNSFDGAGLGIANNYAAALNASGNWWGANAPLGVAAEASGSVDQTPWLDSGTDTSPDPGFQGDYAVLHADDDGPQVGTTGRIQEAVGLAAAGGTVLAEAGTYRENVVVDKALTVEGAGQNQTVVQPALSNPVCGPGSLCGGAASNVILVRAGGVTLRDLTVDGDNPELTSGVVRGGADLDARNGIIDDYSMGTFDGLTVHDVTVRNVYLRGIYAASGGTGFDLHHNTVSNVRGEAASIGIFNFGGAGTIASNTVSDCNDAVSANWSRGTQFIGNAITASGSGIHSDNAGAGGTADLIRGNSVASCDPGGYGIWTFVPYLAPTVEENTVTDCEVGLSAWGQGAAVTPLFRRNTVTGTGAAGSVGAYITTDLISWGYTDISVRFEENAIAGFETGVVLTADPQTWNPYPWENRAVDAVFYDNSLVGALGMGAQGTYACDASANWWGTDDPAAVKTLVNGGAIADYTPWFHAGTDTAADPGFQGDFTYLHADDDSPQTGAIGRLREAVERVAFGGTVLAEAGTYVENVLIDKPVTLAGADRDATVVLPALSAPNPCSGSSLCGGAASNVFLVQANAVTIRDLTVDGDNPLLTSGIIREGADLDARNGIITNHAAGTFTALEVHDTTVRNIYLRGMYASSGGTFIFHHNAVDNVQGEYASIGIFAWYGPGTMASNTVSRCNDAVSANHSRGIQFLDNAVSLSGSGVHTDNAGDGGGTPDLIRGNTVTDCTPGGYGIWTFAPYLAPMVEENTVANCAVGLSAWGQGAAVTPLFRRNTVTGTGGAGSVGAYVTTDLISWGYADISVRFEENAIAGFETGVYLTADPQTWNPYPWESRAVNAVFYDNSLVGALGMGAQGTYACDASANWWGTNDPAAVKALANGGAIADYTPWFHAGTDTTADPGFQGDFTYLHADDDSPQTGAAGPIQEGLALVLDGLPASKSTVEVEEGAYGGAIGIEGRADLRLLGSGRDATLIQPTAVLPWNVGGYGASRTAAMRVVDSTGIDVSGLTFDYSTVAGTNVTGVFYWNASGRHSSNRYRAMGLPANYYEITSYWRAPGPGWDAGNRAPIGIADSEFVDTGRLGLVTHEWVHAVIEGNTFTKTTDDFGYAMEIGSASTAVVSGNTITGYDTPAASDHSQSGGIYIENSFTSAITTPVAKPVEVSDNLISGCQWGIYIGNEVDDYAGAVAIQVALNGNTVRDAAIAPLPWPGDPYGGITITDEDRSRGSSVTVAGGGNALLDNGPTGINIVGGGDADITVALAGETVTGHGRGIRAEGPSAGSAFALSVTNSDLSGNALYGVENTIAGTTFDAQCDWWGTPTGPTHAGNPGGAGSASTDGVDYSPWAGTNTFDCAVKYAVPTRLVFIQQPTDTVVDTVIAPPVALRAEDDDGSLGYNFHGALGAVAMAIGDNPSAGTLAGTVALEADHGVVAFDDLAIDAEGAGYTLVGTAGAPWTFAPESDPFDILLPLGEVSWLFMQRNSTDGALVDLRFTDVGDYNYNFYVSTSPVTHPLDVTVGGWRECAATGVALHSPGWRERSGYDAGAAGQALYFLVTADFGKANSEGPMGVDSEGAPRAATAYCRLP